MEQKILCGLDIGTNSVGWCLTDENNKIIKRKGKSLWGVRMFEEASTAAARRGFRQLRRRYNRRQERISLLQSMFKDEISKCDPSFFYRLSHSAYVKEDLEQYFKYPLFADRDFTDKEYYDRFPTIYHLRHHLIHSKEKEDIRFIYLALHHLIKYRGHFIYEGQKFEPMSEEAANDLFKTLNDCLKDYDPEENEITLLAFTDAIFNKLKEINSKYSGLTIKKENFGELLNPQKNKFHSTVTIPLMVGGKVDLSKLKFEDKETDDLPKSLCVKNETYEDDIQKIIDAYPEHESLLNALLQCKFIYDFFLLGKILGSHKYLADAMVEKYKKHHADLVLLKEVIKRYAPEKYDDMFRTNDKSYSAYIGSNNTSGKKNRYKHINREDFYKELKAIVNAITKTDENTKKIEIILKGIENEDFLNLINSTDNGVFPYQLNLAEIQAIIENQSKFYPFLTSIDEDSYAINKKIESLLTFRIPYYVGPLFNNNEEQCKFSWVVREKEKIYPWNFDKVVNKEESAKVFIQRMQNKCTYLHSCYCLPKSSIIFSYYNVLSYINKVHVNGADMDYETKMNLIKDVFAKNKKVSKKDLLSYFKTKYGETVSITSSTGKDIEEIQCNMASYYDFANLFGKDYVKNNIDLIEQIILDITIFEDKAVLENRLREEYKIEDEKKIKAIKALNYKKYGSISRELLTKIISYDKNGEIIGSVLDIMEHKNQNLQEILYDAEYGFQNLINEYNKEHDPEGQDKIEDYVDNLYVSPGMKRALIQAYKIIDELEHIVQKPIDEFYVECTRSNQQEKKRTTSRYQRVKDLYDSAKNLAKDDLHFADMQKLLEKQDPNSFRSDAYYLYFTQLGRCMYSGEPIDISEINNRDKYDIDHILPQSMVKDDSLSNRVLVKKTLNAQKTDIYPIPQSILFNGNYKAAYAFYHKLKENKLITEEKYSRLTRVGELKEEELSSFVNRQLVFTNQAVKGLVEAIKYFKDNDAHKVNIIYAKGENVSAFRKRYEITKSREANNFHHAHDAYLNIVVGRVIEEHFKPFKSNAYTLKAMHAKGLTTNPMRIFEEKKNSSNPPLTDSKGNIIWKYGESISEIKTNIFERFDIFTTTRAYYGSELLSKVTINPHGVGTVPLKKNGPLSDISKYGGFSGYSFNSYALLETREKGKFKYILEAIPGPYFNHEKEYLDQKYADCKILIPQLKINTVIKEDGRKFAITGKTGPTYFLINRYERRFSKEQMQIIKKIDKLTGLLSKNNKSIVDDSNSVLISPAANSETKAITLTSGELIRLYDDFLVLLEKRIYSYSSSISLRKQLLEKKDQFVGMTVCEKASVLATMLNYLKCNVRKGLDLSALGLKKSIGILTHSQVFSNCKIVYESITGFYTKEYQIPDSAK